MSKRLIISLVLFLAIVSPAYAGVVMMGGGVVVSVTADYIGMTADDRVYGLHGTYATARGTFTNNPDPTGVSMMTGQSLGYYVSRAFLKFDTSGIPSGAKVTQVNMKLVAVTDASTTNFDVQIVSYDWSAGISDTTYDGCLDVTDSVVWRNTSGMSVNTQYTSPNLSTSSVTKAGYTYYCLRSSLDKAGTQPSGDEYVMIGSQDNPTAGYRPVLTITYTQ